MPGVRRRQGMSGVTIILATPDPAKLRVALMIAAASTALGDAARIFFSESAVRLLGAPPADPADADYATHGLPTLAALCEEAFAADVTLIACQSGLALAGLDASRLDPRIEAGGMVSTLAADRNARIIAL